MRIFLAGIFTLWAAAAPASECAGTNLFHTMPPDQRAEIDAAVAGVPYHQGLLWRASKDGQTMILVGTYHFDDPRHDEIEVKERKDRVDDALNATRAAVQEGVVVGGGVALVQAGKALDGLKGENSDQDAGIAIVRRALEAPMRQIAENAGVDGAVVAGKVRESSDKTFGFNAQTEEYGDMFKFGVIDPAKVVRTALEDAASVAGLLITTEAMIAEKPEPKGQGGGMPDMGGMGGMM
jgi:hypothetical protein